MSVVALPAARPDGAPQSGSHRVALTRLDTAFRAAVPPEDLPLARRLGAEVRMVGPGERDARDSAATGGSPRWCSMACCAMRSCSAAAPAHTCSAPATSSARGDGRHADALPDPVVLPGRGLGRDPRRSLRRGGAQVADAHDGRL